MDKAFRIAASRPTDSHASPIIDSEWLTEDRFRDALRRAVIEQNFERSYTLTLTNGEIALPSGVILEKMKTASLYQAADTDGELSSFEERYIDFQNFIYPQLSAFTVRNSKLCYREADQEPNSFDGDVVLNVVALPDIPATLTDPITMPDTLADKTSENLAEMLIGQQ